jgi:hypothetical protein
VATALGGAWWLARRLFGRPATATAGRTATPDPRPSTTSETTVTESPLVETGETTEAEAPGPPAAEPAVLRGDVDAALDLTGADGRYTELVDAGTSPREAAARALGERARHHLEELGTRSAELADRARPYGERMQRAADTLLAGAGSWAEEIALEAPGPLGDAAEGAIQFSRGVEAAQQAAGDLLADTAGGVVPDGLGSTAWEASLQGTELLVEQGVLAEQAAVDVAEYGWGTVRSGAADLADPDTYVDMARQAASDVRSTSRSVAAHSIEDGEAKLRLVQDTARGLALLVGW